MAPTVGTTKHGLELWGGLECTVNRVDEDYHDQCAWNGHEARALDDIETFAGLGLRKIRYPALWEKIAPDWLGEYAWSATDARLEKLRACGVSPIVGLLHHGSGPRYTSLVDDAFPEKLATFAAAVARRYPWVEDYTPVNEPLTTARFSGLYGVWYPHGKDSYCFLKALYNQVKGTALAMRAIREVNPRARLVQTEDLGQTFSSPLLAYQARFENHRRWLSFDMLCGLLGPDHPLWKYVKRHVPGESRLHWLLENPCPPDLIGVNHYPTSDRYLDERLELYPEAFHGGNARHRYADVSAHEVLSSGAMEFGALLARAYGRYGIPVAITEAHLGSSREEQVRWLKEIWDTSLATRAEGVDVRAVTAWALLGSFDWNSLVTRPVGYYEPGVFDVRSGRPRPTAIAHVVRKIIAGEDLEHPVLATRGWWRRGRDPERAEAAGGALAEPLDGTRAGEGAAGHATVPFPGARAGIDREGNVAVTGAILAHAHPRAVGGRSLVIVGTGRLARAFVAACARRGLDHVVLSRERCDVADSRAVGAALAAVHPWAVVNTAGSSSVDDSERDPQACYRRNVEAARVLARACDAQGVEYLGFSSALVFDGLKATPYVEDDIVRPVCAFGRSKAHAEEAVRGSTGKHLLVRLGPVFTPDDSRGELHEALAMLARGGIVRAARDVLVSPSFAPDVAEASLDLLVDGEHGVWHLANQGVLTHARFLKRMAAACSLPEGNVREVASEDMGWLAERPANGTLGSSRGAHLPGLDAAIERYAREWVEAGRAFEAVEAAGPMDGDRGSPFDAAGLDERRPVPDAGRGAAVPQGVVA